MAQITLTAVGRTGGLVHVQYGREGMVFGSNAEAADWAQVSEDDLDILRRMLGKIAVARNLIPGGAGGPVNLRLTYNPLAATLGGVLDVRLI